MNSLALILVLVLWLPAAIVIIYNFFWDIRFWQMQDYRFDRVTQHLRWDFSLTHRRPVYTIVKAVLFMLLVSFVFFPGAIAPILAVLISFGVWLNEMFSIIEKLISHRFPYLEPTLRNISILVIATVLTGILPLLFSLYLLSVNPPELSQAGASLIPNVTSAGIEYLPLTYIFLVFSSMLAIAYDLGSPVIVSAIVLITSPFAWLETQFYRLVAYVILRRKQKLMIIAITGSYGKTTTRQILEHLLKHKFKVASTAVTETSLQRIALAAITETPPGTDIFIAEINGYQRGQIAAMTELLNPQIAIMTGIDNSHVGLFGSLEQTLDTKAELIKNLQPRARVIYNGDDELLMQIAGKYSNNEIFYYTGTDPQKQLADNTLEVDSYTARDIQMHGHRLTFTLLNQTHELEIAVPAESRAILNSLLGAIAAASEAGMSMDAISSALNTLPKAIFTPELIAGDNGTLLIADNKKLSLKGMSNLLAYLKETTAPQRIVVTAGITDLGKYKQSIYTQLAREIQASADVLITYDQHLAQAVMDNNSNLQIFVVDHINDLIYNVRTVATPGAAILLAGALDPLITAALRDE